MSKPTYISVLRTAYKAATMFDITDFDCNDALVTLVYGLPMKRTQEALRERYGIVLWAVSQSTATDNLHLELGAIAYPD